MRHSLTQLWVRSTKRSTLGTSKPAQSSRFDFKLALSSLNSLINLVLPARCMACDTIVESLPQLTQQTLCPVCWTKIDWLASAYDDTLGVPVSTTGKVFTDNLFTDARGILNYPDESRRLAAIAKYDGLARELIRRLKYSDKEEFAHYFAKQAYFRANDFISRADVVMPVPMHYSRLWKRGYNQSLSLARDVASRADLCLDYQSLTRIKASGQQARLSQTSRLSNLTNSIRLAPGARKQVAGKKILLVDDVLTTGSTLLACAKVLEAAGAAEVSGLVIAIVEKEI